MPEMAAIMFTASPDEMRMFLLNTDSTCSRVCLGYVINK